MKTNAYEILKRPIITEKSMSVLEDKVYTFEVDPRANSIDVKRSVETIFKKSFF